MLSESQGRFGCMMEEGQLLGARLDAGLQTARSQVPDLRTELADTHRMIHQLAAASEDPGRQSPAVSPQEVPKVNGSTVTSGAAEVSAKVTDREEPKELSAIARLRADDDTSDEEAAYHSREALLAMDRDQIVELCLTLQSRHRTLRRRTADLRSQASLVHATGDGLQAELSQLTSKLKAGETEAALMREALAALKADRKRLKAEKFDLLNQMKQLYQTLEDKESELRDFIRNYEQRIKENNDSLRSLAAERDALERERWSVLKRAREEADRCVTLAVQLNDREVELKQASHELGQTEYSSDHEVSLRAGPTPPAVSVPALSPAAPTTCNGRGSSADSGVRVSSDRDSVAAGTSGNLSDSTTSGEAVNGQRASPAPSPLPVPVDLAALSRSAEQLDSLEQLERRLRPKGAKQGTWGSISRVFSRQKQRKHLHVGNGEDAWSPQSPQCPSPLTDELYAEKLRLLEEAQQLPMERWKASMVLAWLQVTLGMPQYGPACAENVRSGKVMLELTDVDLERVLCIAQPMHKRKLRLAIEELRQPHLCKYPYISQLNHAWVAAEWLPDVGLAQYADLFSAHLIDGRLLAHLTRKDMEKYLSVTRKFHQVSLMHGIQLLRLLQFDRQVICERRQRSEISGDDVLVWTNARFVQWARSIDLSEYADNLKDSGVHGAMVILELSFTTDTLATALGIPQSKTMLRRHLSTELDKLVRPARALLDEEARQARWERERRRPERPGASATLGRAFSRSYASGLQRRADRDNASLRPAAWRSSQVTTAAQEYRTAGGARCRSSGLTSCV
ncbi:kazrin-like isoform X2 [Pollicipes pollicipes]|uniref:kazrin-like isoform X2 n=1 Tax=Pollicipes pollicipes TaxID=41117 RepID=UPI0018856D67|nr:kazrin-like isoform X2 [Pollicipes pollicipes]